MSEARSLAISWNVRSADRHNLGGLRHRCVIARKLQLNNYDMHLETRDAWA